MLVELLIRIVTIAAFGAGIYALTVTFFNTDVWKKYLKKLAKKRFDKVICSMVNKIEKEGNAEIIDVETFFSNGDKVSEQIRAEYGTDVYVGQTILV